jgi:hypothetical protein
MNKSLKQIASHFGVLVVLFFCSFSYSNAQTPVITNPTFYDDTNVHVPLQFGFPFYGRTFTNSWMHSNGVVSFLDPLAPIPNVPYNPGQWAYCCEGLNLVPSNPQLGPQFNYMIAPLWTDLYPVASSTFRTEGTTTYQKYFWNNIAEISNMNNLNTFSLEIRPSGFIGAIYNQINIQNQNVTAGITGDIALGQMQQFYYGRGILPGALSNWSVNNTPGDQCTINPLSSPTCAGYTEAMCVSNPLYSTSCSGYQQAYFTQQCAANPLYNVNCPGYASAYLTYQCSINPLFSTTCEGYESAYFNQQCSLNSLYNRNCPGYETAYFNQQCSLNSLYSTQCPGYETAYFNLQCSLNSLYSTQCPGYQQAYFNQQCSLNGLYSTQCSNYAEAYATKMALENSKPPTSTTTTTETVTAPTISSSGETKVALVADPIVNSVVTTTATSASPAQAATATVPLVQQPQQQTETKITTAVVAQEQKKEEKKDATTTSTSSSSSSSTTASTSTASSSKDQPKTARQELQERRETEAKAKAIEDGKNLAENIGKAVDMEQQKMVQNVVLQAMAFVPGFDVYNRVILVDKPFYRVEQIYKGQVNVDNKILSKRMFGPSDQLHNEMIEAQYKK